MSHLTNERALVGVPPDLHNTISLHYVCHVSSMSHLTNERALVGVPPDLHKCAPKMPQYSAFIVKRTQFLAVLGFEMRRFIG
uniref:Uncharacterized protein n=1 Tax=Ascaris lumbricoides TaxID=6252 RepID=A0A0M3I455_ASCLU